MSGPSIIHIGYHLALKLPIDLHVDLYSYFRYYLFKPFLLDYSMFYISHQ